jgi:hypothetical protein
MQLLKLRCYQIKRDLGYWVFIFSIGAFLLAKEIGSSSKQNAFIFIGLIWLILYSNYSNRKDLNFLRQYFTNYKLQICVNYNLIVLPISLGFLFTTNWQFALLLHIIASFTVLITFKYKSPKLFFITNLISSNHFEWISGIRKHYVLLILTMIIALLLSPVLLFGIVALFGFNTILIGFYNQFEPRSMLNSYNFSTKDFLLNKIRFIQKSFFLLNAPILFINSIFNPNIIWFNIGILLAFLLIAACSVYIKYSYYQPNEYFTYKIEFLFLYASVIFPYLLPLSFITYYTTKRKAILNLSNYLE